MTFTYSTITEANTFIRCYNGFVAPQQGGRASLVSEAPGCYVVAVA